MVCTKKSPLFFTNPPPPHFLPLFTKTPSTPFLTKKTHVGFLARFGGFGVGFFGKVWFFFW